MQELAFRFLFNSFKTYYLNVIFPKFDVNTSVYATSVGKGIGYHVIYTYSVCILYVHFTYTYTVHTCTVYVQCHLHVRCTYT